MYNFKNKSWEPSNYVFIIENDIPAALIQMHVIDINTGVYQVRDNPVCSATETTCGIDILPEVGLSVTISTDKYAGFDIVAVRSVPLLFASSRDFLYQRD